MIPRVMNYISENKKTKKTNKQMGIWDSVQQISNKSSLPGIILWTKSSVCDELKKKKPCDFAQK